MGQVTSHALGCSWSHFSQQQQQKRAASDRLASIVLLVSLVVAAVRTAGQVSTLALTYHGAITLLALYISLKGLVHPEWRGIIAVALRLGTASSPVITKHAEWAVQQVGGGALELLSCQTVWYLLL
jgi:hypothetical protein